MHRLRLDSLEERAVPATFTVTSTIDGDENSLRDAVIRAFNNPGFDEIVFDPALNGKSLNFMPSGEIFLGTDLAIRGPGADKLTITGLNDSRHFTVGGFATVTISGLTLTSGRAGLGGSIYNEGNLTLEQVAIVNNSADQLFAITGQGGGIYNNGSLTIRQSLIAGNKAVGGLNPGAGGGIYNDMGGNLTIENSTFSGNVVTSSLSSASGGAIYSRAPVTLRFVTIAINETFGVTGSGAGIALDPFEGAAIATLDQTIIANNRSSNSTTFTSDVSGPVNSLGYNLISDSKGGTGFVATDLLGIDPKLQPLQNNTGPTSTHQLSNDSPAVNAGNPTFAGSPNKDQRNRDRPRLGRVDIGAVERQELPTTPPPPDMPVNPPPPDMPMNPPTNGPGNPPTNEPGNPPATFIPPVQQTRIAVGVDVGNVSMVRVYDAQGNVVFDLAVLSGEFTGGVRVATADVTGDGIPDVIIGAGPGGTPVVEVYNGASGGLIWSRNVFEGTFAGGVFVVAADLNGDGVAEVVVTPDEGGGPVVRILTGNTGEDLSAFLGIDDPAFRGGARAALGDFNGDGRFDLIISAGFGGGPRVAIFDGTNLIGIGTPPPKLLADFFVFEQTLRNGVYVGAGDINGDGFADLVVGGGPGGGPRVMAVNAVALLLAQELEASVLLNFFAGDDTQRGGVRISLSDINGDGIADILTAPGGGGMVQAFDGRDGQSLSLGLTSPGGGGAFVTGSPQKPKGGTLPTTLPGTPAPTPVPTPPLPGTTPDERVANAFQNRVYRGTIFMNVDTDLNGVRYDPPTREADYELEIEFNSITPLVPGINGRTDSTFYALTGRVDMRPLGASSSSAAPSAANPYPIIGFDFDGRDKREVMLGKDYAFFQVLESAADGSPVRGTVSIGIGQRAGFSFYQVSGDWRIVNGRMRIEFGTDQVGVAGILDYDTDASAFSSGSNNVSRRLIDAFIDTGAG